MVFSVVFPWVFAMEGFPPNTFQIPLEAPRILPLSIFSGLTPENKRKNGNTRETHRRTQHHPTGGWAPVRKLTYSSPRKAKRETAASTGRSLYLVETRCTVGPWKKRLYPERALELETWNANCPIWGVTATKNNKYNKKGRKHPLGQRARSCH